MSNWKYFKKSEFTCKCGCGIDNIAKELVDKLDEARALSGTPFVISSGCRCPKHNTLVGGKSSSAHITTKEKPSYACDIAAIGSRARFDILRALFRVGFDRVGVADDFIHVDVDPCKAPRVVWTY